MGSNSGSGGYEQTDLGQAYCGLRSRESSGESVVQGAEVQRKNDGTGWMIWWYEQACAVAS